MKDLTLSGLRELIESNEYEFADFIIEDGSKILGENGLIIENIETEGGGEGGSEYCYTIVKVNEDFYKIEYSYYSYEGFELSDASMTKVYPKQKTITVYE